MPRTKQQAGKLAKNKGNNFERKIAKELQNWWNGGKVEGDSGYHQFQRTPMSGGSQLKDGWGLAGDIATTDEFFPFHIECKKQEGWSFSSLMSVGGCAAFSRWWEQSVEDSAVSGKEPVVIFSKNNVKTLWAIRKDYIGLTQTSSGSYLPKLELVINGETIIIFPFSLVLRSIPHIW